MLGASGYPNDGAALSECTHLSVAAAAVIGDVVSVDDVLVRGAARSRSVRGAQAEITAQ